MRIKKLTKALVAALGISLMTAAGSASALQWYTPFTVFQDDNLDYVVDNDGDGFLSVGDRLISVFEYINTEGIFLGQGPSNIGPAQELTGVADITVIGPGPFPNSLAFGPSGAAGVLNGFAPGTMAAIFLDNSADLQVINAACGTRANCLDLAGLNGTDGSSLFLTAGFFGDPDESWFTNPLTGAGFSIPIFENAPAASKLASFNFSLSIGVNGTGKILNQQACLFCIGGDNMVDVVGSGDVLGGQGLNHDEWSARSDTDAQLAPAVPEPGTLALLGLGLAAAGAMRRRVK